MSSYQGRRSNEPNLKPMNDAADRDREEAEKGEKALKAARERHAEADTKDLYEADCTCVTVTDGGDGTNRYDFVPLLAESHPGDIQHDTATSICLQTAEATFEAGKVYRVAFSATEPQAPAEPAEPEVNPLNS